MDIVGGILLGVAIGIISGLVGIGGGALLTPILIYFYKMNQHQAQGTSLAMLLLPSGIFAFWKYYQAGNADLKLGLLVCLGVFIGGYFGGMWAQHISDTTLRKLFALFLIGIGIRMFLAKG
jgi:uncharacterized membrane protein YfcA